MSHVYSECTVCYKALTEEEQERNQEKENYYYTICDECLNKYTSELLRIVNEQ